MRLAELTSPDSNALMVAAFTEWVSPRSSAWTMRSFESREKPSFSVRDLGFSCAGAARMAAARENKNRNAMLFCFIEEETVSRLERVTRDTLAFDVHVIAAQFAQGVGYKYLGNAFAPGHVEIRVVQRLSDASGKNRRFGDGFRV